MTKRIAAFGLALLLVALLLCGCGKKQDAPNWDKLMRVATNDSRYYIIVDTEHGTQYLVRENPGAPPVVMVDLDGKPVPFPGFDALEGRNG